MDAYIRKIFEHDLTHEISITNRIVQQFFSDKREYLVFRTNTEEQGFVSINDATDPRLGGDFKRLCGKLKINDYIVIIKSSNNEYKLFVISPPPRSSTTESPVVGKVKASKRNSKRKASPRNGQSASSFTPITATPTSSDKFYRNPSTARFSTNSLRGHSSKFSAKPTGIRKRNTPSSSRKSTGETPQPSSETCSNSLTAKRKRNKKNRKKSQTQASGTFTGTAGAITASQATTSTHSFANRKTAAWKNPKNSEASPSTPKSASDCRRIFPFTRR